MDVRTLYQAQLFAPAFLFQTFLEAWGSLIEPRHASPPARPAQRIEPAAALPQPVILSAPVIQAREPDQAREPAFA